MSLEKTAIMILKRGDPLPVDIETRLLATGINPVKLRKQHEQ